MMVEAVKHLDMETAEIRPVTTAVEFMVEFQDGKINMQKVMQEIEVVLISTAFSKANGVRSQAAKMLGLNRTTLVEKMKRYKLITIAEAKAQGLLEQPVAP